MAADQPNAQIVSTSGTTGLPKPVAIPLARIFFLDSLYELNTSTTGAPEIHNSFTHGVRLLLPFPHYHSAGTMFLLFFTVYRNSIIVEPPLRKLLTLDVVCDCIEYAGVQRGWLQPWICKALASSEKGRNAAQMLDDLMCTGGPLDHQAGEVLSELTHVYNALGSTEYSFPQYI